MEARGRKDGVSGQLQDHYPQPQGHQRQQLEEAVAAVVPAGGAATPVQENVVHRQPIPIHQDQVNPRPTPIKKRLGGQLTIEGSSAEVNDATTSIRAYVCRLRRLEEVHKVTLRGPLQIQTEVEAVFLSYESTDSPPPPDDTDEDPTSDIEEEEEECKRDSFTKSSRKHPGDHQDPPGLAKSQKTVGSNSTSKWGINVS